MKWLLSILFIHACSIHCLAQIAEPFIYEWPPRENKIKEDTTGSYYRMSQGRIFFATETNRIYRIFDDQYRLIEEGEIGSKCIDCPARAGRCTSYYSTGQVKARGFYNYRGAPIGTWQHFYPNAQLQELVTYDAGNPGVKIGSYESYYQTGALKSTGFYCTTGFDTTTVDSLMMPDPRTGEIKLVISKGSPFRAARSHPCGAWRYYNERGELIRREDHDE